MSDRISGLRRAGSFAALLAASSLHARADGVNPKIFNAGTYSFSDELGGFRILSATGAGTKDDPIVVTKEFDSAYPATLTIRAIRPIQPFGVSGNYATGFLPLKIVALNNSTHAWIEFEFELQSILGQPSDYGDGLSFDQAHREADAIKSDSFAEFNREFEPYDGLLFLHGKVDPLHGPVPRQTAGGAQLALEGPVEPRFGFIAGLESDAGNRFM